LFASPFMVWLFTERFIGRLWPKRNAGGPIYA